MAKPLVTDAENESIANPMAMSIIVMSNSGTILRIIHRTILKEKNVFYQCNYFDFQSGEIQNILKSYEWELHPLQVETSPTKLPSFYFQVLAATENRESNLFP